MRAREPDRQGFAERDGGRIHWELFGHGERTVFFVPTWSIVQSRFWKFQVPYFARYGRVLTMDARGSGGSDRPTDPKAHSDRALMADALAVMDASGTDRAALVSMSRGAHTALLLAAEHPDRVTAAVFIGSTAPLGPGVPERMRAMANFDDPEPEYEGWLKYNAHHWRRDLPDFLDFFFHRVFPEPHSTKQIEDCVGWGLETTAEVLIATQRADWLGPDESTDLARRVRCPVLVIHGDGDEVSPHQRGAELATATGGRLLTMAGSGHAPTGRDPVAVNLALADFLIPPTRPPARQRAVTRPKRALFVSSPIGLGHARRDLAIARELRKQVPGLVIDWLAQDPVTRLLEVAGETVHPMSRHLASESSHIEGESEAHSLHVFQAFRRMDEILVANFMVFLEATRQSDYDLWVGDEAWEVDYFLHENPELKSTAYVWITDFVGWLPMPAHGESEALLTAEYNTEMIEHVTRFPRVRDRAIFIGRPEDVVPDCFGPGLPGIREWTERHYEFTGGYVLGHEPGEIGDREALRVTLGYRPGEVVCVASVGGSGVGEALLKRAMEAYPAARREIPELRLIAVAGPRLDPARLPQVAGVELLEFVPDLDLHLAACDVAITQGGLTTTMELTAARRPFLYFPLHDHFEQNFHVRHRLERHRAGRRMDFDDATPERLAAALRSALDMPCDYAEVESGTAARAAELISSLL